MDTTILMLILVLCNLWYRVSGQPNTIVFGTTPSIVQSTTPSNVKCVCVPMGACPTTNTGIDIRIVNTGPFCANGQVYCCTSSENLVDYTCGRRKINETAHPSGQASYGAYPWQAALLTTSNVYVGSGVLINANHVLTVAHKVATYVNGGLKIRLGEWDGQVITEPNPFQEYTVQKLTIHPKFNALNLQNDVAVIRLNAMVPLSTSPNINTACLPTAVPAVGTRCWVSGWGKDAFGTNGQYQSIMKEVDVPILNQAVCETSLRATRLGQFFVLDTNSFLCAGGEAGKDACTGDGGSPLVCQSGTGQFQVVGMVAWGIGCANGGIPGVYVNVLNFIPWIYQQLN